MIKLTEQASKKIKQQIIKRGKGLGLRLGVKTTGCSGLAYILEYVDAPLDETYLTFQTDDVNLWISQSDIVYLTGATLDWVKNGLNEGFEFQNPNARDVCGCGESFRV